MHYEVLVEDQSGGIVVDVVLAKILGPNGANHSWRTLEYKGLGHIPKNLHAASDPARRVLLARLPRLLRGYGRSLDPNQSCVVVVVDADKRDCIAFKQELLHVLSECDPRPRTLFRIAVEESEAWLLGDRQAMFDGVSECAHIRLGRLCARQRLRHLGSARSCAAAEAGKKEAATLVGSRQRKVSVGRGDRTASQCRAQCLAEFPSVSRRHPRSRTERRSLCEPRTEHYATSKRRRCPW